jgi:hypothetical protein
MTCEITGCGNEATGLFTWGPYPNGDRNKDVPLCPACARDLWERSKGPVSAGTMHFGCRAAGGEPT